MSQPSVGHRFFRMGIGNVPAIIVSAMVLPVTARLYNAAEYKLYAATVAAAVIMGPMISFSLHEDLLRHPKDANTRISENIAFMAAFSFVATLVLGACCALSLLEFSWLVVPIAFLTAVRWQFASIATFEGHDDELIRCRNREIFSKTGLRLATTWAGGTGLIVGHLASQLYALRAFSLAHATLLKKSFSPTAFAGGFRYFAKTWKHQLIAGSGSVIQNFTFTYPVVAATYLFPAKIAGNIAFAFNLTMVAEFFIYSSVTPIFKQALIRYHQDGSSMFRSSALTSGTFILGSAAALVIGCHVIPTSWIATLLGEEWRTAAEQVPALSLYAATLVVSKPLLHCLDALNAAHLKLGVAVLVTCCAAYHVWNSATAPNIQTFVSNLRYIGLALVTLAVGTMAISLRRRP